MRILFLGNNWLGWQVLKWLKETDRDVAGIVIHPPDDRKYGKEILETANLPGDRVFTAPALNREATRERIRALKPDVGLSVMFGTILDRAFLSLFPKGCYNLHPSYLPHNKGTFANVWTIVDRTPAGVTFHVVDEGVDTGPIVAQREVEIAPTDTGETLYRKLERAGVQLFRETWPLVEAGTVRPVPQDPSAGKAHLKTDVERIDRIDLDRKYKARDLINILRARTFPPYRGAYFVENGKKVYMELKLYTEDEA